MPSVEKECLDKYLKNYIDDMIISDIKELKNRCIKASYPYLALSFSGIDFFGGLERGFKNGKSGPRFNWFIKHWMGKTNHLYKENGLSDLIYDSCRSGIFHEAALKNTFRISSYEFSETKHLYLIEQRGHIFFHSKKFAFDFIEAQKNYRQYIFSKEKEIERVYNNLLCRIKANKKQKQDKFNNIANLLIKKGHILFESESLAGTHTATETIISNTPTTITEPPDEMD